MAFTAQLRFYEELNFFLPAERRRRTFGVDLKFSTSVKDLIESCGVPHTEVDLILANGQSVGFDYLVQPDDRISVYPVFESFDISDVTRLQERPLRDPRFAADVHLGRLARNLRLLGFDVAWRNNATDPDLLDLMRREKRCILTRDRRLLMRKEVAKGYCVRSDRHLEQTREVISRFDLAGRFRPFTRCSRCNGLIRPVAKAEIEDHLETLTRIHYDRFTRCEACGKIYWGGSHLTHLLKMLRKVSKDTGLPRADWDWSP